MAANDPEPPVADDDFPEFAAPPRHKPGPGSKQRAVPVDNAQGQVDDVIAELRRKRAEGQD